MLRDVIHCHAEHSRSMTLIPNPQYLKITIIMNLYIVILQYINIKMGASKTAHFTKQQNSIATIAKALGHPARIAIIEYLLKVDHCICGDIVNELPLAQPTISQHLKELKNCGLIKGTIEGTAICYCINEKMLNTFQKHFSAISATLTNKKCC
jgi:predicted transcriptional regulator